MKKLICWGLFLGFIVFLIWLFGDNPEPAEAQYGNTDLKYVYSKSTTIIIDNANGTNTGVIPITLSATAGGHPIAWGSFCVYMEVDTLTKTGKTSAQDSLTVYYKELKSYTNSSSYDKSDYDSTALISNFNWDHGYTKKLSLAPDPCFGFEFRGVHTTTVSDSIQLTITLVYQ